jgi:ADP-ribose pyrophosphatase YjhB (NUDIX family)
VPPAPQRLRALAVAVVLHRDHVLCAEGYDSVKRETFYRPLGGEIEFGERAGDAAVRELAEETGRRIAIRGALGVVENVFTYEGKPGHEVVFEFVAEFAPGEEPPDLSPIVAREGRHTFTARWLHLAEVLAGAHTVYPDDLPSRLAEWVNQQ